MRLRNIPGASEYIAESPYVIHEPESQSGHWAELFPNRQPLHLEIGTGKGRFLIEMAKAHPEINYIGVEKYSSVLLKAVKKQEELKLPNLVFVRGEAELITTYFGRGEIHRIYLNFSDPWPKKRYAKRRLPSKEFLRRYDVILRDGGTIEFKTDNRELFDFAVEEVPQGGFRIDALTYDLHNDPVMSEGNIMTEYEEKFSARGNRINKYILSRLLILMLCLLPFFAFSLPVYADEITQETDEEGSLTVPDSFAYENTAWPAAPEIIAETAILIDADTGMVLYGKNMHRQMYPASTTKLLTCLLAAENLDLKDTVTMSETAIRSVPADGSNIGMGVGETITVEEALYGILVGSANEVSNAIAEKISGSVEAFAELMNSRAAQLGCEDSHFVNPNGYHDDAHYTSAYDLARIGMAFFDNEITLRLGNTPSYHFTSTDTQPDDFVLVNKHQLITGEYPFEGILGGKTGYTSLAGETLVTCARRNGLKLICVVMKDPSEQQFSDTAALLNYGFSSFEKQKIAEQETGLTIDVPDFMKYGSDVLGNAAQPYILSESDTVLIPKECAFADLDREIRGDLITYYFDGIEVGTTLLQRNPEAFDKITAADTAAALGRSGEEKTESAGSLWDGFIRISSTGKTYVDIRYILVGVPAVCAVLILLIMIGDLLLSYNNLFRESRKSSRRIDRVMDSAQWDGYIRPDHRYDDPDFEYFDDFYDDYR